MTRALFRAPGLGRPPYGLNFLILTRVEKNLAQMSAFADVDQAAEGDPEVIDVRNEGNDGVSRGASRGKATEVPGSSTSGVLAGTHACHRAFHTPLVGGSPVWNEI